MPFYGRWERTLDAKWRLAFPAKIREGIGPSVFVTAATNGGLMILPGTFRPPEGEEMFFQEVSVREGYFPRIVIGEDVRKQFDFRLKPHSKVLLVGCGDHLELYPAGSR